MTELSVKLQLDTATANVRDMVCGGGCRHKSAVECAQTTYLVFPYRGVYVRHVGRNDSVAESNQVLFFNKGEEYRISHPVEGGDACLSVGVAEHWLDELAPKEHVRARDGLTFRRQRLRIDARTQALVAMLRYSLDRKVAETLEAETLTLTLIRRALGERTSHAARRQRRAAETGRSRKAAAVFRPDAALDAGRGRGSGGRFARVSHAGLSAGRGPAAVPLSAAAAPGARARHAGPL